MSLNLLKSLYFRLVIIFVCAILIAVVFSYQLSSTIRKSEILRAKSEIIYLISTITPNLVMGNLVSANLASDQFGFSIIPSLPKDYEVLYRTPNVDSGGVESGALDSGADSSVLDSSGAESSANIDSSSAGANNARPVDSSPIRALIFTTKDEIGFQIIYEDYQLIAKRPIQYSFANRQFWVFLAFFMGIIVLLGAITLRLVYPLKSLRDSLVHFSSQAQNSDKILQINTKRKDEIGELIGAFNTMSEQISKMLKVRELILKSIGHELKTPLTKIRLFIEVEKAQNPTINKPLDKILLYLSDLQKLIENVLNFERLSSGKIKPIEQRFLVETLIFETLRSFEDSGNIALEIGENFPIQGDLALLSLALRNLIENALKYDESGRVRISAQQITPQSDKTSKTPQAPKNTICVWSKGAPLSHPMHFYTEPFFRDEQHERIQGHGLGLSIVNDILLLHNYKLTHDYQQGQHCFCMVF